MNVWNPINLIMVRGADYIMRFVIKGGSCSGKSTQAPASGQTQRMYL